MLEGAGFAPGHCDHLPPSGPGRANYIFGMRTTLALACGLITGLAFAACSSDNQTAIRDTGAGTPSPTADASTADGSRDSGTVGPDGSVADGGSLREIRFQARVGDMPFSCESTPMGIGTMNSKVEPLDFRVYVHDVRLVKEDDTEVPFELEQDGKWQLQNLALLDFEDKSGSCANGTVDVHAVLTGTAPDGTYKGIRFAIGVPFALNHADVATAPTPLNLSALFWNWNGGYKFARIDSRVLAMHDGGMMMDGGGDGGGHGGDMSVFNVHLGSTECVGNPADGGAVTSCGKPNRGGVSLLGFDPFSKPILADFKALLANSDMSKNGGGPSGCMSGPTDPECPPLLEALGVNITTGQPDATKQKLFRVE
jgi:uncharacterized repeat protein (TIGR04052 family)